MKTNQLLSNTICSALFAGAMLLSSTVFAQVKIGTNPTTIGATNNLEVEASTAGNKVSVDKTTGKVTIADGSQGAKKILTSDANGVATWEPLTLPTEVITGDFSPPATYNIVPPATSYIPNSPLTLNKGVYILQYYAQLTYTTVADPTTTSTLAISWPRYIYFDFIVESGSATLPSYRWAATGLNNGPFVIPTINTNQVGGTVSQIVTVVTDGTVIKPRYYGIPKAGQISNIGPIVAVKLQ